MNKPTTVLAVDIECRSSAESIPSERDISNWANKAYKNSTRAEVAILIVDQDEIQSLNKSYRNKDQATNVLSFNAGLAPVYGVTHLGDLVLCANVIEREASEQNKSIQSHWAHMTIHGMLHLQDYDHINTADAEVMEAIEIALLASLNIANPYLIADEPLMGDSAANQQ